MKLSLVCLCALVAYVLAGDDSDEKKVYEEIQNQPGYSEAFKKNVAEIRRKKIDAHFGGTSKERANDAQMEAFDNRVKMLYGSRLNGQSHAGYEKGLAKADIAGKHQAAVQGYGKSGGVGFAGDQHGSMKFGKKNGNEQADFIGNGARKIDTEAIRTGGELDKFSAAGDDGRKAMIDPVSVSKTEQTGGLFWTDEKKRQDDVWLYEVENKNQNDVAAVLSEKAGTASEAQSQSFLESLLGRRQKKYRCTAQKIGESLCMDQNGRTVGKTVASEDGNVVVYNKFNIPVARGKARKIADGKYQAIVGDGLMEARTDNIEYYDCMREMGKSPSDKIKLHKPLTFNYNSEEKNGATIIKFPDCFTIGGRVELAPGVDASRLATEFVVNVLPAGKLRCMDPGTCGRECYYCDYCYKDHKLDILKNGRSNLCTAKGGTTQEITATLCPTPDSVNWAMCPQFDKSFASAQDYWKKKGDIDVQMRFYLRPANLEALKAQFFKLNAFQKIGLKAEWIAKYSSQAGRIDPTDPELLEFYIEKNQPGGDDELIGCQRAVVKYGLGGSKVNAGFLIEGASVAGNVPSIFSKKPCKEWTELDQQQFAADQKAAAAASSGGSSGGGLLDRFTGGLFGGNRG